MSSLTRKRLNDGVEHEEAGSGPLRQCRTPDPFKLLFLEGPLPIQAFRSAHSSLTDHVRPGESGRLVLSLSLQKTSYETWPAVPQQQMSGASYLFLVPQARLKHQVLGLLLLQVCKPLPFLQAQEV